MPLLVTKHEDQVYPDLPVSTVLNGVITDIQEREATFDRGTTQMVEFTVEIDDPEIPPETTVKGSATLYLSPKSKLNKWITALRGGRELAVGEDIDIDEFMGKPCQFMVECKEKPNRAGIMTKFYNISDFVATRSAAQTTQTRQTAAGRTGGRRF